MKTGRNAPCPCGSGRQYQKCCGADAPRSDKAALNELTPRELIERRRTAFEEGDFAFIYDSYHAESYFRRQFPDREAYLEYGRHGLAGEYTIRVCRILRERFPEPGEAQLIFLLEIDCRGVRQESLEMARLLRTERGWRYHSSQKLERSEFSEELEQIDFKDFERVRDKVFF